MLSQQNRRPLCLTSCGAPGWLFPLSQKDDDGCGCCPRSSCLSSLLASHGMAEACFWQRECVALSSGCAFYMCSWKFCRPTSFREGGPRRILVCPVHSLSAVFTLGFPCYQWSLYGYLPTPFVVRVQRVPIAYISGERMIPYAWLDTT